MKWGTKIRWLGLAWGFAALSLGHQGNAPVPCADLARLAAESRPEFLDKIPTALFNLNRLPFRRWPTEFEIEAILNEAYDVLILRLNREPTFDEFQSARFLPENRLSGTVTGEELLRLRSRDPRQDKPLRALTSSDFDRFLQERKRWRAHYAKTKYFEVEQGRLFSISSFPPDPENSPNAIWMDVLFLFRFNRSTAFMNPESFFSLQMKADDGSTFTGKELIHAAAAEDFGDLLPSYEKLPHRNLEKTYYLLQSMAHTPLPMKAFSDRTNRSFQERYELILDELFSEYIIPAEQVGRLQSHFGHYLFGWPQGLNERDLEDLFLFVQMPNGDTDMEYALQFAQLAPFLQPRAKTPKGKAGPKPLSPYQAIERLKRRYFKGALKENFDYQTRSEIQTELARYGEQYGISKPTLHEKSEASSASVAVLAPPKFQTFIKENNLEDLLQAFTHDPTALIQALSLTRPDLFQDRKLDDFIQAYIGLQLSSKFSPLNRDDSVTMTRENKANRQHYIRALLQAAAAGEKFAFSKKAYQQQRELLLRLSRPAFQHDPRGVIEELRTEAKAIPNSESLSDPKLRNFLEKLHNEVADYLERIANKKLKNMRTQAFPYQKEGAIFLSEHDRALLLDEAGLGKSYQVIAAVEDLELKHVLWITTATNKDNIRQEIVDHSKTPASQVQVIISGDVKARRTQLRGAPGKYKIIGFDLLVELRERDPESFKKLAKELDAVVVDEAQFMDNSESLRSQAIRDLKAPRVWLTTASPYQSDIENIWVLLNYAFPEEFPNRKAFRDTYLHSTTGLMALYRRMQDFTLRRTKPGTLSHFESPEKLSFYDQLKTGVPRIPRKKAIAPQMIGEYYLLPEQTRIIAEMVEDFEGWAERYNENLPAGAHPVNLSKLNGFAKFQWMHKAIYEPQAFGIQKENPMYGPLDRLAEQRGPQKKMLFWAWNRAVLDEMEARYGGPGTRRLDGQSSDKQKRSAINDFQNDPNVNLLLGNYRAGGVGISLSAAHAAAKVQLPLAFPSAYQVENRNHRVIGLKNWQHAREESEDYHLVAKFDPNDLAAIEDPEVRALLSRGTLVEQTLARLTGGETLYRLVLEGFSTPEQFDALMKSGLYEELGISGPRVQGRHTGLASVVRQWAPLWKQARHSENENLILDLVEAVRNRPELSQELQRFIVPQAAPFARIQLVNDILKLPGRYVREKIVSKLPTLLEQFDEEPQETHFRLTPAEFIAKGTMHGLENKQITQLIAEVEKMGDTPRARALRDRLYVGLSELAGNNISKDELARFEFSRSWHDSSDAKVNALYQLGLLAAFNSSVIRDYLAKPLSRLNSSVIANLAADEENRFFAVSKKFQPLLDEELDTVLALLVRYRESGDSLLISQFQETLGHFLRGDYKAWRYEGTKESGNTISYRKGDTEFWKEFATNLTTTFRADRQNPNDLLRLQERLETPQVRQALGITEEPLDSGEPLPSLAELGRQIAEATDLAMKQKLHARKTAIEIQDAHQRLLSIDPGIQDFSAIKKPARILHQALRQAGEDEPVLLLETLLSGNQKSTPSKEGFVVEETDDPNIIMRMGALAPELSNCFTAHGNPDFNRYIVTVLGSPNIKLLTVKDGEGKTRAVAAYKIKKLEDGSTVLYLERPLQFPGQDYQKQMLDLLKLKARSLSRPGAPVRVMREPRRTEKDTTTVYGTGAYTESEYVEPVFGIRRADNIRHQGVFVD